MKALTLTQPWASLVAIGAKTIETRSWRTNYRGPLLIHAARLWTGGERIFAERLRDEGIFDWPAGQLNLSFPPFSGLVIARTTILDVVPVDEVLPRIAGSPEWEYGDYSPGRFAWLLGPVHPVADPFPWRGALSLWDCPDASLVGAGL